MRPMREKLRIYVLGYWRPDLTCVLCVQTQFPRVNGAQFVAMMGKTVTFVGEVISSYPHRPMFRAPDGTEVQGSLPMGEQLES
jgi:hypothetical protein